MLKPIVKKGLGHEMWYTIALEGEKWENRLTQAVVSNNVTIIVLRLCPFVLEKSPVCQRICAIT